jgi:YVTN family beta-propeller protein
MRITVAVAAAFLVVTSLASGQERSTPKQTVLALSKQDHTVSIIDPSIMKIVATVPVGDDPHEIVASSDGRTAYVSNYGFGRFHSLAVIDLIAQKQLPFIELGALKGPHGLDFVDGKVWFTAEAAKAIGSYDPAAKKIDWIMGTGQNRTHMIYVFSGAKRILTTNVNSATVTILDKTNHPAGMPSGPSPSMQPSTNGTPPPGRRMGPPPGPPGGDWEETVIPVGHGSEGFDVSPDGKQAWVANAQDGTISVIDLAAKKVVATLHVNVPGANRLKFTPDGKYVLVSPGLALVVLDTATRKVIHRLSDIHASGGILMQPDGTRAYVACGRDGYVAAVDLKTWRIVGKVDVAGPDGLAWADRK